MEMDKGYYNDIMYIGDFILCDFYSFLHVFKKNNLILIINDYCAM